MSSCLKGPCGCTVSRFWAAAGDQRSLYQFPTVECGRVMKRPTKTEDSHFRLLILLMVHACSKSTRYTASATDTMFPLVAKLMPLSLHHRLDFKIGCAHFQNLQLKRSQVLSTAQWDLLGGLQMLSSRIILEFEYDCSKAFLSHDISGEQMRMEIEGFSFAAAYISLTLLSRLFLYWRDSLRVLSLRQVCPRRSGGWRNIFGNMGCNLPHLGSDSFVAIQEG